MKPKYFPWILFLLALGIPSVTKAQFAPNDEVELLRDEPLFFNASIYRQGHKGERFRVGGYRPDSHKVFVLGTDSKGKTFALNVSEAAVAPVAKEVTKDLGLLNDQAFAALRTGQLEEAQRLMLQLSTLDRERNICSEIATHLGSISSAQLAYQQGLRQQEAAKAEAQRMMRNATVADRPNAFNKNDNSNRVRAAQIRKDAAQLEANARAIIDAKQQQIAAELKLLRDLVDQRQSAGAYTEASDIGAMVTALASRQGLNIDSSRLTGVTSRRQLASFSGQVLTTKATDVQHLLEEARRDLAAKKLNAALKAVQTGLNIEPGSYSLHHLEGEISRHLESVGKTYAIAVSKQQLKQYEKALKDLQDVRDVCIDHEPTETLAATLLNTIAEKGNLLSKAKAAESAEAYGAALGIYETYAMDGDTKRILPLYAKQREADGDFLLAYSLYERIGSAADMQRIQMQKEQQLSEYQKAKVLLVEGNFEEALSIFRKYKDAKQENDTLRQQGAFFEADGQLEKAMEIYRQAQLPDELARVKHFAASRAGLLDEATHQEKAANCEKALELFQEANAKEEIKRLAEVMAKKCEQKKDYQSAAEYFEMASLYEEAGRIRNTYDLPQSRSRRKLSNEELIKRCKPKCVTVTSDGGLGSGFFIAKGGYILTNHHVVGDATRVMIQFDNKEKVSAKVIASSHVPDAALLQVEKSRDYPFLEIGNSDTVEDGSEVSAIGSGQGYMLKFKPGVISGSQLFLQNQCFQITVPINHGDSGSPLLNDSGRVIGINTFTKSTAAILDNGKEIGSGIQNINFAIKINEVRKLLKTNIPGFQ